MARITLVMAVPHRAIAKVIEAAEEEHSPEYRVEPLDPAKYSEPLPYTCRREKTSIVMVSYLVKTPEAHEDGSLAAYDDIEFRKFGQLDNDIILAEAHLEESP